MQQMEDINEHENKLEMIIQKLENYLKWTLNIGMITKIEIIKRKND